MNMNLLTTTWATQTTEVIAEFGNSKLVKTEDGQLRLRGGTARDYLAAKEWVSLFFPEAVIAIPLGN
jgi:hypothetical protein